MGTQQSSLELESLLSDLLRVAACRIRAVSRPFEQSRVLCGDLGSFSGGKDRKSYQLSSKGVVSHHFGSLTKARVLGRFDLFVILSCEVLHMPQTFH